MPTWLIAWPVVSLSAGALWIAACRLARRPQQPPRMTEFAPPADDARAAHTNRNGTT